MQPLTKAQLEAYHRQGYIGPFTLCSPEEMARYRQRIEVEVLTSEPQFAARIAGKEKSPRHYRHLDCRVIYVLAAHPAVVAILSSILGPDLLVWRTSILLKQPGTDEAKEIPFHQDGTYFGLYPKVTISCWLAIDEAHERNSCVKLIPGTHKTTLPTIKSVGTYFPNQTDPSSYDVTQAISMPLKPGQFFVFDEGTLHGSDANTSTERRMCISSRYTVPFVHLEDEREQVLGVNQISGQDRFGINTIVPPPPFNSRPTETH